MSLCASPCASSKAVRKQLKLVINHDMAFTEDQEARIIEESARVFALNNALVATVQHTGAFSRVQSRWAWRLVGLCTAAGALALAYWQPWAPKR